MTKPFSRMLYIIAPTRCLCPFLACVVTARTRETGFGALTTGRHFDIVFVFVEETLSFVFSTLVALLWTLGLVSGCRLEHAPGVGSTPLVRVFHPAPE